MQRAIQVFEHWGDVARPEIAPSLLSTPNSTFPSVRCSSEEVIITASQRPQDNTGGSKGQNLSQVWTAGRHSRAAVRLGGISKSSPRPYELLHGQRRPRKRSREFSIARDERYSDASCGRNILAVVCGATGFCCQAQYVA